MTNNNVTNYSKIVLRTIYQLPITLLLVAVLMLAPLTAYGFQGANVTDNKPRYAFIQAEDFSWYTFRTINSTTERLMPGEQGNNLSSVIHSLLVSKFADEIEEQARNELQEEQEGRLLIQQEYKTNTNALILLTQAIKYLTVTLQEMIATTAQSFILPAYASTLIIDNPASDKNTLVLFNATFLNGTNAIYEGNQTASKANLLIILVNGVIDGTITAEDLEDAELLEVPEEEEEEITEEEEEDGNGGGGSSDGGGEGPIEPDPSQIEPQPEDTGEEGDGGDTGGTDGGNNNEEQTDNTNLQNATLQCLIHPYCPGELEIPTSLLLQTALAQVQVSHS